MKDDNLSRDERPNEIFASQWLDLFMRQSMESTEDNNLCAEPTLTELVDNNTDILKNRITEDTINRFIEVIVKAEKHAKYVNLLIALVNCEGEAIVDN